MWRMVAVTLFSMLAILWFDNLGTFAEIDGMVYDSCVRMHATYRPVPAKVLLVYSETSDMQSQARLQRASSNLLELGADINAIEENRETGIPDPPSTLWTPML